MVMMFISSNVCLVLSLGIFNVVSILFIEGVCVDALALAMMPIGGSTFHPLLKILYISGFYFSYYSFIWYFIIAVCEFHELYC